MQRQIGGVCCGGCAFTPAREREFTNVLIKRDVFAEVKTTSLLKISTKNREEKLVSTHPTAHSTRVHRVAAPCALFSKTLLVFCFKSIGQLRDLVPVPLVSSHLPPTPRPYLRSFCPSPCLPSSFCHWRRLRSPQHKTPPPISLLPALHFLPPSAPCPSFYSTGGR